MTTPVPSQGNKKIQMLVRDTDANAPGGQHEVTRGKKAVTGYYGRERDLSNNHNWEEQAGVGEGGRLSGDGAAMR